MIANMSRVEIVCLSSERARVVATLQGQGLLHLEDVPLEVEDAPDFLSRVRLRGEDYETNIQLEEQERTLNEIRPLLSVETPSSAAKAAFAGVLAWTAEERSNKVREWAEGLRDLTRKRAGVQDSIDLLQNYRRILVDVMPHIGGENVTLGKGTRALVLTGNVKRAVARLEDRFQEEIGDECKFHYAKSDRKSVVGLIRFPENHEDTVNRILNQEGIAPVDMRDEEYQGATVGEIVARIDRTVGNHRTTHSELLVELEKRSRDVGAELHAAAALVSDELAKLRVQQRFAESVMTTVIHGWTPTDRFGTLESAVEKEFPGQAVVTLIDHEKIEHDGVPTQLRNPKFFEPFEVVLKLFQPPAYGTVDPTIMLGVAFILFYGFILGDVVYGVAVIGAAGLLWRKWGHIQEVRSAAMIGLYMGISAILFGVLYGEYAGDLGHKKFHAPIFFDRAVAPGTTQLLIIAVLTGIVHVVLALCIGIREEFKHKHTAHAHEKLGMLLALLAVIIGVLIYFETEPAGIPIFTGTMATVLSYVAGAMAVAGVVYIFRGMGIMGLIGLIEVISLGGNVLSYARLMALGIASIAVANIANTMPDMMGNIIGIPAAIMIHLANIGLGIASPTIHSLRLNVVEFMPKFYKAEGKSFTPFRKETQW